MKLVRLLIVAVVAMLGITHAASAQTSGDVVKIGVLADISGEWDPYKPIRTIAAEELSDRPGKANISCLNNKLWQD